MQAHKSHYHIYLLTGHMPIIPVFALAALALATFTLAACSPQNQSVVADTAVTPLNDLNIIKEEIPAVLIAARNAPYAVPVDQTCDALETLVRELDQALDPDLDTTVEDDDPNLLERASGKAGDVAIGTLRTTVEDIVPYRKWVRKLSGAERHSKQESAAIAAGVVRRAFVKGMMVPKECS